MNKLEKFLKEQKQVEMYGQYQDMVQEMIDVRKKNKELEEDVRILEEQYDELTKKCKKQIDSISLITKMYKEEKKKGLYDCDRCKDKMRIYDYENGDRYNDDSSMPCPDCQE